MSFDGKNVNITNNLPLLIDILSDIIMSYVPCELPKFINDCINVNTVNTVNIPFIRSITEFSQIISKKNYTDFLNILSSLTDKSVIDIINILMNRLDYSNLLDSELQSTPNLIKSIESTNLLNSTESIESIKNRKTFTFISLIIKRLIEGLIRLAIIINPSLDIVSNAYINPKNWNMPDIVVFEDMMKKLYNKINNVNIDHKSIDFIIEKYLEHYLIQQKDIINKDININSEIKRIVISDHIKNIINKVTNDSTLIDSVIKTTNAMFFGFLGYSAIKNDVLNRFDEIIVITACDIFMTNGSKNNFMEKYAVITSIASKLNSPYRPIICRYINDIYNYVNSRKIDKNIHLFIQP